MKEVKLTIVIEDPREVERRRQLGIEDERGCSRDDMANALVDVYEGRIPKDRAVLRELAKEMTAWPRLEDDGPLERSGPKQSLYAKVTDVGVDPAVASQRARVDWDAAAEINPGEGDKDFGETLPPVVGFSLLYLVSVLPIAIGIVVVLILFVNSLQ
ncbi:hypothetical protein O6H91_05G092600 [Diphasiastrum complanatum]|uniref:Uncharacterized protein n=1 Tax=Diphasiastrum complanatum TaxID=34168 RepID=A0ACC2DQS8_DIPCM|nr:hypothetical protein O6H91_05G092600 [Diphasiastrum complanatum]